MTSQTNPFLKIKSLNRESNKRLEDVIKDFNRLIEKYDELCKYCQAEEDMFNGIGIFNSVLNFKNYLLRFCEEDFFTLTEKEIKYLNVFDSNKIYSFDEDFLRKLHVYYTPEFAFVLEGIKAKIDKALKEVEDSLKHNQEFQNNFCAKGPKEALFNQKFVEFIDMMMYLFIYRGLNAEDTCKVIGSQIYLNAETCKNDKDKKIDIKPDLKEFYIRALDYFNSDGTVKSNSDIKSFEMIISMIFAQANVPNRMIVENYISALIHKNEEEKNEAEKRKEEKDKAKKIHEALAKIKEYYNEGKIIKPCDLETLKMFLDESKISDNEKEKILRLMTRYTAAKETFPTLEVLLNPEEQEIYLRALGIKNNLTIEYMLSDLETLNELYLESDDVNKVEIRLEVEKLIMDLKEILDPPNYQQLQKINTTQN